MKVIAAISNQRALVEMTDHELQRLSGRSWSGCMSDNIGKEYDIIEAWGKLAHLELGQANLASAAARLRAIADLLQPIACEINQTIDGPKTEG